MQFLQHNWRNKSDITDLRQEVYVRVCEAARQRLPDHTKRFVFTTARNLLIDRMRQRACRADRGGGRSGCAGSLPSMRRAPIRSRSRATNCAVCRQRSTSLPPRCREAMILAHVEGLDGPRDRPAHGHRAGNRLRTSRQRHSRARRHALRRSRENAMSERVTPRDRSAEIEAQAAAWLQRRRYWELERRRSGRARSMARCNPWRIAWPIGGSMRALAAPNGLRRCAIRAGRGRPMNARGAQHAQARSSPIVLRIAAALAIAAVLGVGAARFSVARMTAPIPRPSAGTKPSVSPTARRSNSTPTPFCARA